MENGTVRTDLDLDVDGAKKLRLIVRLLGFGGSFGYGYLSADGSIEARIIIGILFGLFGYVIAEIVRHFVPSQRHLGKAGTKSNDVNPPEADIEKKQLESQDDQDVNAPADEETVTNTVGDWGAKEWGAVAGAVFLAFTYFSSPSSDSINVSATSPNKILDKIWRAYTHFPGNYGQGTYDIEVKGEVIKKGTVPPSAANSSAKGRLPAYLACYDFVSVVVGAGDVKSNMCIYFVDNPTRGTKSLMWRGRQYIDKLYSTMSSDGFVAE